MFRSNRLQKIRSQFLGLSNLCGIGAPVIRFSVSLVKHRRLDAQQDLRQVDVHGLLALHARVRVPERRSQSLDLDSTACLSLNVFDEHTLNRKEISMMLQEDEEKGQGDTYSRSYCLCSDIEVAHRLETDEDLLLCPFAALYKQMSKSELGSTRLDFRKSRRRKLTVGGTCALR